jgi:predicted dehydrogenase
MDRIRAAVVGVGHLGKVHARVYHEISGVDLVAVVDTNQKAAEKVAGEWGAKVLDSVKDLVGQVDAVSIAVPTVDHAAVAGVLIEAGIHVLVEKPMTSTLEEGRELVAQSRKAGVVLQVGHVERFNPAVMAAEKHIDTPLFIEAHRLSPFSFRSADIDVVLDLMIHDLDIISHLVGAELEHVDAVGVPIFSEKVDIANARLVYASGCVANVTASRVSAKQMRKIRVFSKDAYVSLDYGERRALIFRKSQKVKSGEIRVSDLAGQKIPNPLEFFLTNIIEVEEVSFDEHEPLKKEVESFLSCVRGEGPPAVSGEAGLRAMEEAEQVKSAIRSHLSMISGKGKALHGEDVPG